MTSGPGLTVEAACADCLRRSWLIARLSPRIERACGPARGTRTPELLKLADEELVSALEPGRTDQLMSELSGLEEGDLRELVLKADCWACCCHDDRFPEGLRDTADGPRILIGRGGGFPLSELTPAACVTVVGSRRATSHGLEVAGRLGREIATTGLVVVSGMALGIDAAAHRGALESGRTVAVLASGADTPYPVSHTRIYRRIVENGLVLSELPPGTTPRKWGFPARNRVMAAMSGMTVVVEAARRSGSLITAEMASDAGREVGAVPGQVTIEATTGSNELLSSGAAVIRDGNDVIDRVIGVGARIPELSGPALGAEHSIILDAVERGGGTVDEVAEMALLDAGEVAIGLARLEVLGYLNCSLTGVYSRTGQVRGQTDGRER